MAEILTQQNGGTFSVTTSKPKVKEDKRLILGAYYATNTNYKQIDKNTSPVFI